MAKEQQSEKDEEEPKRTEEETKRELGKALREHQQDPVNQLRRRNR